jgi:hypothetical protein
MMNEIDVLMKKGLDLPKPKYDQVILPPDITELSSEQLAEMFTILTGWADYFASQLVQAQLKEREAQRALEIAESRMLITKMGSVEKGSRVTLVKAQISVDPEILQLGDVHEERYAYRKILEMMVDNQERDITLVSREITRRTNESRMGRRDTFIT